MCKLRARLTMIFFKFQYLAPKNENLRSVIRTKCHNANLTKIVDKIRLQLAWVQILLLPSGNGWHKIRCTTNG